MRTKNQLLPKNGAEQDDGICNVQAFLDAVEPRYKNSEISGMQGS